MSEATAEQSVEWEVKPLADLAEAIQYGYTAKAKSNSDGIRYLRITDIQDDHVDWDTVPSCDVGDTESEKYLLSAGDLVFARTGATVGKSFLLRGTVPRAVFASYLIRVKLRSHIDPRYVAYFFQSPAYWNQIAESSAGIGQPNVNGTKLAQIRVPVAPQKQQREIVAELEKQFSRLDEAVANLQRVKANLKRYKASVLKDAVEGRLVPTEAELARREGRSFENGAQLLQRFLEARRSQWKGKGKYKEAAAPVLANLPTLPEGWTWATMPQLGELNRGKSKHRPRDDAALYGGPHPFIQTGDVRRSDGSITEHRQTYSELGLKQSRLWPVGTLCITIAANIAETGILKMEACFPDSVVGFISDQGYPTTGYVEFFIRTARDGLDRFASATAQKNINLEVLDAVAVSTPPLAEQKRIVAEVDRRLSLIRGLESEVDMNLQRAQALRQSILWKAFSS